MIKINPNELLHEPLEFVNRMLLLTRRKYVIYKTFFIILNITSIVLSFASVALFASVLWHAKFTTWFLLTNVSISAGVSLITSLLNLFVIKAKMNLFHERYWRIIGEINHYDINSDTYKQKNNYSKEYRLFLNTAVIVGIVRALDGDEHG
jgi:hypothetical protein